MRTTIRPLLLPFVLCALAVAALAFAVINTADAAAVAASGGPPNISAEPESVSAVEAPSAAREAVPEADAVSPVDGLEAALGERLAVWTKADGTVLHVRYCREAAGGCDARLEAFASMLASAAEEHDIDPYLLAAVAVRESGLHPGAVGPRGSAGILQLNPRGIGAHVDFVRDPATRLRCLQRVDACQGEVVEHGAEHLKAWVNRCGSIEAGLGGYNRGRCGQTGYSRRVLEERGRLVELGDDARSTGPT